MAQKDDNNSPSNLWTRRSKYVIRRSDRLFSSLTVHATSNSNKLNLSTSKPDSDGTHTPSAKRFGSVNSKSNPFNTVGPISTSAAASPSSTGPASSAFGLGSGAFASFGSAGKTPRTPGSAFEFGTKPAAVAEKKDTASDKEDTESRRPPARKSLSTLRTAGAILESPAISSKDVLTPWPLKYTWIMHYRPPTSKNSDYEKSIKPLCRMSTAQEFWMVYSHFIRPSALPTVSDYHFFREGIRPVWEDEENKRGGKWTMRVKKGIADRFWEDLVLAMIGDQFAEASDEVCGAVVSVRSGEDVFSIWTKNDGGRNVKIRETIKRVLNLPADTNLQFRSHDDSITQRDAADQARKDKVGQLQNERRNTLNNNVAKEPSDENKV
nr:isoform 2 of eukaryotic translation initiation factor 4e type 2 [Quercus suber]